MDLNKENMKKIRKLILFTILILVALWNYKLLYSGIKLLGRVLLPFAVGGAIAFVLNIPMYYIEEKIIKKTKLAKKKRIAKLTRPISFIMTLLLIVGIIALVVCVFVPQLGRTIMNLGKTLQEFVPQAQTWAIRLFKDNPEVVKQIQELQFDWEQILEGVVGSFRTGTSNVIGTTFTAMKNIVSGVSTLFISFVFGCYLLFQKEKLSIQVKKLMYAFMPCDWTEILIELGSVTQKQFFHFLTGQCVEAVIMGCLFFVVLNIFNIPYALLISALIAFTALIPIFGPFIGCISGILLIFMVIPAKVPIFLALFLGLQQVEDNFIYPHVVGNSVGLPPIWVLAAVSVGASLMGIIGMIIFVPIVSVIYTILRGIVNRRLKERKIEIV